MNASPEKKAADAIVDRNEGSREELRGQGERMLEVVLATYRYGQLAKWLGASFESAATWNEESLSRKFAALRYWNEGAHDTMRGEGEKMLELVLKTADPHLLGQRLAAVLEGAAAQADENLAKKLVEAGAKIRDVALYHAIRSGSVAVVDLLLENGVSAVGCDDSRPLKDFVDGWEGEDPLGFAAKCGNVKIARSLMRAGADAGQEDDQRRTPLLYAIERGDIAMVEAFLEDGVDLNHHVDDLEWSSLDEAAVSRARKSLEILRMLVDHGAEVNSVDFDGQTALHKAAEANRPRAVLLLVEAGAGIEKKGSMATSTPLHAAAGGLAPEAALALLQCGADIHAKSWRGKTALHLAAAKAAHKDAVHVVDLLLRWGADENVVCDSGRTAEEMVGTERVNPFHAVPENVERVRGLLARAPADRAWRRRALLVMCRAYPDRVRLGGDMASLTATIVGLVEDGVFRRILGYL